jgi:hypothetical protein
MSDHVSKALLVGISAAAVWVAAAGAGAAGSGWAAKANAACIASNKKVIAAFGGHPTVPSTRASMFGFMLKIRPLEFSRLRALEAIPSPPPGATKAFALARTDIAELDAAVASYRAGNEAAFGRQATVWWNDQRTGRALAALGAKSCT